MIERYIKQTKTAKLFPTATQVAVRMKSMGQDPRAGIYGTQGEMIHAAGMELLEALKGEMPYFTETVQAEIEAGNREDVEAAANEGLTSEINTCQQHIGIRDTLENIQALLEAHPFGFKHKWTAEDLAGLPEGEQDAEVEPEPVKPVKVDYYADKRPVLKDGKLTWVPIK